MDAALSAIPPQPQMPRIPMRLRSTSFCNPRIHRRAKVFGVYIRRRYVARLATAFARIGRIERQGYKPISARVCAYRPLDCSLTAPNGPLTAIAASLRSPRFGKIQIAYQSDPVSVLEGHLTVIDFHFRQRFYPVLLTIETGAFGLVVSTWDKTFAEVTKSITVRCPSRPIRDHFGASVSSPKTAATTSWRDCQRSHLKRSKEQSTAYIRKPGRKWVVTAAFDPFSRRSRWPTAQRNDLGYKHRT